MPEEQMGKFVADVATLPMRMVAVVMDDANSPPAGNGHRREAAAIAAFENGTIAPDLGHSDYVDIKVIAGLFRLKPIELRQP
jgi:hypothetical protein